MKYSFSRALAVASVFSMTIGWQAALAQSAVEYLPMQPMQAQQYTEQGEGLSKTLPQSTSGPSAYQLQEEAIKKGLAENNAAVQKEAGRYNENSNLEWERETRAMGGGHPRLHGMAHAARHMLGRTAQVALPTAGAVLIGAAINRAAMGSYGGNNMNNMARRNALGMAGLSVNPMTRSIQMGAMQNGSMASFNVMGNNPYGYGYGNPYFGGR